MKVRTQKQDPAIAMINVSSTSFISGFIYQWSITKVWSLKGRRDTVARSNHLKQWMFTDVSAKYGS